MSFSPQLSTTFTNTKLRTPNNICDLSGMCSVCSDKCTGLCEIGLSAIRGSEVAYPYNTNTQQFASEKNILLIFRISTLMVGYLAQLVLQRMLSKRMFIQQIFPAKSAM